MIKIVIGNPIQTGQDAYDMHIYGGMNSGLSRLISRTTNVNEYCRE